MAQENAAYDLSVFENRTARRAPHVEVKKGSNNRKLKQRMKALGTAAVVIVLLGLVWGLLYSQATLTELTTDVQRTQRQLSTARSEHDYLAGVMDSKTSVKNVEEVARAQLGLVKLDKSQITYATLEDESVITVPRSGWRQLMDQVHNSLLSVMDYLNP